jgi:hypothetical protein
MNTTEHDVLWTLQAINQAWRSGQPSAMTDFLHPDITMAFPGFAGALAGRDALISSFTEFCSNARVLEYEESDHQIQIVGDTAVATFRFRMVYERTKYREQSKGRDLWVFQRNADKWLAVWRTMLDLDEVRQDTRSGAAPPATNA